MTNYGKNKLTELDKEQILALKGVKSGYEVAKQFKVSHTAIYKIWDPIKYKPKKVSSLDTQILLKMIPVFIDKKLKVDLDPKESLRVDKLIQEVMT